MYMKTFILILNSNPSLWGTPTDNTAIKNMHQFSK